MYTTRTSFHHPKPSLPMILPAFPLFWSFLESILGCFPLPTATNMLSWSIKVIKQMLYQEWILHQNYLINRHKADWNYRGSLQVGTSNFWCQNLREQLPLVHSVCLQLWVDWNWGLWVAIPNSTAWGHICQFRVGVSWYHQTTKKGLGPEFKSSNWWRKNHRGFFFKGLCSGTGAKKKVKSQSCFREPEEKVKEDSISLSTLRKSLWISKVTSESCSCRSQRTQKSVSSRLCSGRSRHWMPAFKKKWKPLHF